MSSVDWDRFRDAIALRDDGRIVEALAEIRKMLQTARERDDIAALMLNEVTCLRLLGRKDEAWSRLKHLRETPASEQMMSRAGFLEVMFLNESKHYQAAFDEVERLFLEFGTIIADDDNRDLYEDLQAYRGMLLVALSRPTEAKPILEEAVTFPQYRARVNHFLGVCHYRLGAFKEAKERLTEGFQFGLPPELIGASHFYLGVTHFQLGAFAWAKQEFEEAFGASGDDAQLRDFAQDWLARTNLKLHGSTMGDP